MYLVYLFMYNATHVDTYTFCDTITETYIHTETHAHTYIHCDTCTHIYIHCDTYIHILWNTPKGVGVNTAGQAAQASSDVKML